MRAVNLEKLLPADIPPGERVLWHGRPEWISLARRAYRVDFVAAYFLAMTAWNLGYGLYLGGPALAAMGALKTLIAGFAAIGLLGGVAWLSARTTLYVVTTRRLVLKIGIALPIFFNLPFSQIASASVHIYSDETGDIPVLPTPGQRIAYLHLWPHARPFHVNRPEPAMRSVRNAREVATMLAAALKAAAEEKGAVARTHPVAARALAGDSAASAPAPATAAG